MAAIEFDAKVNAAELNKLLNDLRSGAEGAAKALNDALGGSVTKKLVLETVTDKNGTRRLVAAEKERLSVTDQIARAQQKLNDISLDSVTSLRQQVNRAKQARDETAKYESNVKGLNGSVTVLNQKWIKQNAEVRRLEQQLARVDGSPFWKRLQSDLGASGLVSFVNGLTQITQGFQSASIIVGQIIGSVNELIDAVAKLQTFSLAFQAIGAGASGAQQALNESSRIALNLGVSLATTRTGFQQLTPVIRNSGGSIADVGNIIEALSSRFAAFGISGDRARRVTNGIIQAFGKGKLQAEELTQQIAEADPAFGTDFARALGVSTAELLKLVKAGQITSDVLIKTIPLLSKSSLLYGNLGSSATDAANNLVSSTGKIPVTLDQVRVKIESLNQLSFEALARGLQPFLFALIRGQAVLSDFLSQLSRSAAVETLGRVLGGIANSIGLVIQAFATAATPILSVLSAIASVVNVLLKFPGASEAVGVAILGKLVGPLLALKQGFVTAATGGGTFGQSISRLTSPFKDLGQAIAAAGSSTRATSAAAGSVSANYNKQAKSISTLATASNFAATQADKYKARVAQLNAELQKIEQRKGVPSGGGGGLTGPQLSTAGLQAELKKAQAEYLKWNGVQDRAARLSTEAAARLKGSSVAIGQAAGAAKNAGPQYERLTRSLASLTTVNANAARGITEAGNKLAAVNAKFAALNTGLNNGTISSARYAEEAKKLTAEAAQLTSRIDNLGRIQDSTNTRMEALRGNLARISTQSQTTSGRLGALGNAAKRFGAVTAQAARGALSALGGLASAIGPIGIALLAVGVAQAAYASATAEAREEVDKSAASAKAYAEIVKNLGGEQVRPPNLGIAQKAWKAYALNVTETIQGIGKAVNEGDLEVVTEFRVFGIKGEDLVRLGLFGQEAQEASLQVGSFSQKAKEAFAGVRQDVTGITAAAEALRAFSKTAAASTTEGKLKITTEYKSLGDQIEQTTSRLNGLRKEYSALEGEYAKTGSEDTKNRLAELKDEIDKTDKGLADVKSRVAEVAKELGLLSDDAIAKAASSLGSLEEKSKGLKTSLENAAPGSDEFKATAADIAAVDKATESLNKQAKDPIVIRAGIEVRQAENFGKLKKLTNELQQETSKPINLQDNGKISTLRVQIQELNRDIRNLEALKVEVDAASIQNAEANIKRIEEIIVTLDVDSSELPAAIEKLLNFKKNAEDIKDARAKITIELLQKGIAFGDIPTSLNNIGELIKELEGRVARLDVNSPDLPDVISQLEEAKSRLDQINGSIAVATVKIIEERLEQGGPRTQETLNRRVTAQQQVVRTTTTDSANYDEELKKLKRFEAEAKAAAMSTDELRKKLAQNQVDDINDASQLQLDRLKLQREKVIELYEEEKRKIKEAAEAAKTASDEKIRQYRSQLDAVKSIADKQIEAAEQLGPAGQRLAELRRQDLQRQAGRGGREGLEAQAQLEDLDRQEKIAAIKKRAAEEEAAIQAKIKQEEEAQRQRDKEEKQKEREIEQQIIAEKKAILEKEREQQAKTQAAKEKEIQDKAKARKEETDAINKELEARGALTKAQQEGNQAVIDGAAAVTGQLTPGLEEAAKQTKIIAEQIKSLDGKVIEIVIKQVPVTPGRWAGGPVEAGQQYRVNELGKEGFLSNTGKFSLINKPQNALWRAPSSGTVIPANILKTLDVPTTGVKASNSQARPSSSSNQLKNIAKVIAATVNGSNVKTDVAMRELSAVQAGQAAQIGKLSRAVDKLAGKNWNVNVHVKPNATLSYVDALNHRL